MENEILIALFTKLIDARLAVHLVSSPGRRGPRGLVGRSGVDGKGFIFSEHESEIRAWAKEFAVKFEDFTDEQIKMLRGPKGKDGRHGNDGKDFIFSEHEDKIREWSREFALKFEDLDAEQIEALRGPKGRDGRTGKDFIFSEHEDKIRAWAKEFALKFQDLDAEQIEQLRGPRGREGKNGASGIDFQWSAHADKITEIIGLEVEKITESLKLRFSDLSADDIEQLRGPRGRDGHDGRGFIFDEHREYFESLRLKFSDLTEDERGTLRLRFAHLTADEKATLKLRFEDLTEEDRALIRGPRGVRGQRGTTGKAGESRIGPRGLPGPKGITGVSGAPGLRGSDGVDGADAPHIVGIDVKQRDDDIVFVFKFSDGTEISSDRVKLPAPVNVYGSGGASGRGRGVLNYDTRIDEPSATVTYVGKTVPGNDTSDPSWQIQKISIDGTETIIEFADSDALFNNVWDDRASLAYG